MDKKRPSKKVVFATFALGLLGLGAVFAGITMLCDFTRTLSELRAIRNWQETPAKIQSNEMQTSMGRGHVMYKTTATYTYEIDGKQYEGTRVSPYTMSDNIGDFQERINDELQHHRVRGLTFRCFVNPDNPSEAILYREYRWGLLAVQIALCTVGWVMGVLMLRGFYRVVTKQDDDLEVETHVEEANLQSRIPV